MGYRRRVAPDLRISSAVSTKTAAGAVDSCCAFRPHGGYLNGTQLIRSKFFEIVGWHAHALSRKRARDAQADKEQATTLHAPLIGGIQ